MTEDSPQTWHYGLVAKWWSEFNVDSPEAPYFLDVIGRHGQPVLDVGCGTGRLLLPIRRAGIDVDGCDVSADMLAVCNQSAQQQGMSVTLYESPMHDLDLPRKYKTIVVSGAFELGGGRSHALEALRRFYEHLEPDGVLALDYHTDYEGNAARSHRHWREQTKQGLPVDWPERGEGRVCADGSVLRSRIRLVDIDPIEQVVTRQIRIEQMRNGKEVVSEEHTLTEWMYSKNEILTMLELTGFRNIKVEGDYTTTPATSEHEAIVFLAIK